MIIKKILILIAKLSVAILPYIFIYAVLIYIFKNLNKEISNSILEYLKVLAWPIVVIIFVNNFKSDIAGLIQRISEMDNPFLGKFKTNNIDKQNQQNQNIIADPNSNDINNIDFQKIVDDKEQEIVDLKNTTDELNKNYSIAQIELDFERIYNLIFSSQIDLLVKVNTYSQVSFSDMDDHFFKTKQLAPTVFKNWSTQLYINFLINSGLIILDNKNLQVLITTKGRAFVGYLSRMNYRKYGI
jgi:hypothetical protein